MGQSLKKEFKGKELKWFGGKHGGHVGIGFDSSKIIDFVPSGKFHWLAKKSNYHSRFAIRTEESFWSIFGGTSATVKKTTILIPVSAQQKQKLDSIIADYTSHTPYDYAFIGMRCGAAAYDILSKLGIVRQYSYRRTYLKIFYPKRLRKRLLKKAAENHWTIRKQEGTDRRIWEQD